MTLSEALAQVELEPGRTYPCRVRGMNVVLRVAPAGKKLLLSKPLCEEDIMLDAWCELPGPEPIGRTRPKWGASFMPDIPEIPSDEEPPE